MSSSKHVDSSKSGTHGSGRGLGTKDKTVNFSVPVAFQETDMSMEIDDTLPSSLRKGTKRKATQDESDDSEMETESGTEAQGLNSRGPIPPDTSQSRNKVQVAYQNLQPSGPGYFKKLSVAPTTLKPAESKPIQFPQSKFGQPGTAEGSKPRLPTPAQSSQPPAFTLNTNFKSNNGDFTFSSQQGAAGGGSTLGDKNDVVRHFDPVVPLPHKTTVNTGEEDEEKFFCNGAKLFRFDAESNEWKERGIGNVKILKHKVSGKFRLLMRRDQVLKICANHYINTDMKLTPNAGSDRSFVWHALDYADELLKPETLGIWFETPEEAMLFKNKFEEAQNILRTLGSNVDTPVTQRSGTAREMTSQDIKKSNGSTSGTLNSVFQFPRDGVTSESGNKVSLPDLSFRKEAQQTSSSAGFGQSPLKKAQWGRKDDEINSSTDSGPDIKRAPAPSAAASPSAAPGPSADEKPSSTRGSVHTEQKLPAGDKKPVNQTNKKESDSVPSVSSQDGSVRRKTTMSSSKHVDSSKSETRKSGRGLGTKDKTVDCSVPDAVQKTDDTLPSRLGKGTKRRGTQNKTDGLVRKTASGTEAQELNSRGPIPPDTSQSRNKVQVAYQKLQRERSAQEKYALEPKRRERAPVEREKLLHRREAAFAAIKDADEDVQAKLETMKEQPETKKSQLRETLRNMTDENNELKLSLNSLREDNEFLKNQLLLNVNVYNPLTILMDWISDQHLRKIKTQEEGEGSEIPHCAKEIYTLENCVKLLPMVIGQLQWMPFVDPKLHMPVIEFIYWSLRQIDIDSQDASMTSTMERLAEVLLKGAVQRGSVQNCNGKPTQSKPKVAHFFKSKSMPVRFLSTLVVLRTAKRMNYLSHAFRSLCVDLKTDEGKILFLQYRCVPIILSHLTIPKKCLLFVALNALVEMAMINDKK
ncbi:coiled-coil domain-containing protein 138 [Aythya fuligula]|uniref:Coiled-coil domain-containing protein 138 n=1 Tax=Aythya fuligula TaxID=219594 RepID=A0A6J3D1D0_AYTFU|nr:coiled-coil domain-containing protein 138 [Aythya fuligula]